MLSGTNSLEDSEGKDWFVASAWCSSIPGIGARALFGASVSFMFFLDKPTNGQIYGTVDLLCFSQLGMLLDLVVSETLA